MAGNITKCHSVTPLQFARFGSTCPLWIVQQQFGTTAEKRGKEDTHAAENKVKATGNLLPARAGV